MSGRSTILGAIKKSKPSLKPLPVVDHTGFAVKAANNTEHLVKVFGEQLSLCGAELIRLNGLSALQRYVEEKRKGRGLIINTVIQAGLTDPVALPVNELDRLYQVFIEGEVAVAENGAIWVNETAMGARILPFISEQLFVVVMTGQLVMNMHEAYDKIKIDAGGFGTFIAGPSKTADIEQSLVIGAHGPRKMFVLLISED